MSHSSYKKAQEYKLTGFQGNASTIPIYRAKPGKAAFSRIRMIFTRLRIHCGADMLHWGGVCELILGRCVGCGVLKAVARGSLHRPQLRATDKVIPTVPRSATWGSRSGIPRTEPLQDPPCVYVPGGVAPLRSMR